MKENISVKPDKTRLLNLLEDINDSKLKIPIFQRDFVWKANQIIELFDSIVKGYPIGSLLFWKPGTLFDTKDKIGPYVIKANQIDVAYVLDGFQRVTTLFSVLTNPKKFNLSESSKELKEYLVFYNLKEKEFTYLKSKKDKSAYLIPLYKVVDTYEFLDFLRDIEKEIPDKVECNELIENAKQLSKILYDYEIPFVEIRGGDIKSAVQIFSRVNSTGTEISEDFMLSALSYNQQTNFLFSDAITEFLNTLNIYNFDDLKRDTILNCISTSKGKIYFDVKIEDVLKPNLEDLTETAFKHIRKAVEFLYNNVNVLHARLVPYPIQLVFISEFFRVNNNPNIDILRKLENWFWATSYSNYFTLYSLSQQRRAYKYFLEFAEGKNDNGIFKENEEDGFNTADFPIKLNYTSVRAKALQLFFLKRITEGVHTLNENFKEQLIFGKKDKTPGNVILRLNSEFENEKLKKNVSYFILNSENEILEKYFITPEILELYKANKINQFIIARESYIKSEESKFVSALGILHVDHWY